LAAGTAIAPSAFPWVRAAETAVLGQGAFRYRVVPGWGDLGSQTPVNDCHGIAVDREGHILLFTNETKNNVIVYDRKGRLVHKWGTQFPGAHGLSLVTEGAREVLSLLIAMSDQQHLLRLATDGRILGTIPLPGGNPRQIRRVGDHHFVAHLGDNWPKDRDCRGFISILDASLRVVSNVGGTAPEYGPDGKLRTMAHREEIFRHPHDLAVDAEGSLYVAQFASGRTHPIKLERV